jgi:sugar phosphate isomerase/epimerase
LVPEPGRRGRGREILWHASLAPTVTVTERVAAAASAGFGGISISPADADPVSSGGRTPEELAEWARDQGIALLTLDSIIEWYPHEPPKRPMGSSNYDLDTLLALSDRFGVPAVGALAPFPSPAGIDDLAGCFARLCDHAADHGLRVQLEFTPFVPVPDLATAWEIVRRADRANGGILFDTWHFFRSKPDIDLLKSIPGERIMGVQVNDGAPGFRESLLKDTFRHRELPGQGSFELLKALRALDEIGGLNLVGPEVLSEELFALDPGEATMRMAEAIDQVFAAL